MGKKGFKDLMVWQQAKDLAVIVYRLSDVGALSKDYSLRDQIRRSVISIASNLAEGDERDTDKESVHFFYIAKGSLAELRTQIEIAHEIGYLEKKYFEDIDEKCVVLGKMIGSLIKVRKAGNANRGRDLCTTFYLSLRGGLRPTKQSHNALIIKEIATAHMRLAMTESGLFKGLWQLAYLQ